ncbi:MarR family transcriptional regulator, partial [Staphylococcus xylosus]
IIRKIYKKELIAKVRSETDESQVFKYYNNEQKQLLDDIIKEVEQINVA